MIDPKEFLNKDKNKVEIEDSISVSGTFLCQECDETVKEAALNEDKRKLVWYCSQKHYSEAKV